LKDFIIHGFMVDFFKIMSEIGNFNVEYQMVQLDPFDRKTVTKYLNAKAPSRLDVYFVMYSLNDHKHITSVFNHVHWNLISTPSEKYTNYEKMVMPFDDDTWYYLFITFGVAFFVVFIVNKMPKKYQDLIFGSGVKMPAYNIVGTFFGIGQTTLPKANFPRIILIFFVLFCLVIRTAYQGVFFEMFVNEIRRLHSKN
jgi:hypothetical protein